MTTRRLVMVPSVGDAPPPDTDLRVVALDTAWTPRPGDPAHVTPLREVIAPILVRIDLFRDALDRLEAWEDATRVADHMTVRGVSWWFRQRPFIWYLVHEHRLWLAILDELDARHIDRIEIPGEESALVSVARQLIAVTGHHLTVALDEPGTSGPPSARPAASSPKPPAVSASLVDRVGRRIRRQLMGPNSPTDVATAPRTGPADRSLEGRMAVLDERVARLAGHGGRSVVIVSHPRVFQVVEDGNAERLVDPQLAPVMRRLSERDVPLVNIALELDLRRDEDWSRIEADERLIPDSYVRRRWAGGNADLIASEVVERLRAARGIRLDVDGVDLAPIVLDRLEEISGSWLASQDRLARAARSLFDELQPAAMFLNHEGIRTPWVAAGRAAAIPIHAVQHGVIYPAHPVYRHARHPGLVIPERTYVYGPYEEDVLLRYGAYEPTEVEVSGSPRLDGIRDPTSPSADDDRQAVRRSLGVSDDSRMLVLSTANHVLAWRFHIAEAMGRILDGPLPGVHVVIKLHPGEIGEGPYRALLTGLAEARGFTAPSITIIHDIDLFRLLRAADAHLGFHSTVLTDAVAAGTTNLIAAGHATADWLGYAEAGVARPVRDIDELRAALEDPTPSDPGARERFLARHFRPGDASGRIADGIVSTIYRPGRPAVELRDARPDDEDLVLGWANDPATRAAGFAPDPIEPEQHHRWFSERLGSATDRLLIGFLEGKPVGQVRLDRGDDGAVEVGIAVAPGERERGVGGALLRAAVARAREDPALTPRRFVARIRPTNEHSVALFTRAGFRLVSETELRGMACLVFERPV
jgi:RimJ/RimL family protein N-acetyltransferase